MSSEQPKEKVFRGIAASPGIAHSMVYVVNHKELDVPNYQIKKEDFDAEVKRLDKAILETRKQIQSVQEKVRDDLGDEEALIFDAHLLVLEDQALIDESIREMKETRENIETALWEVGHRYIDAFSAIDDEYLRERATDIRDVLRRLLGNLTGQGFEQLANLPDGHIVVAEDISPSEAASIDEDKMLGVVTDAGSKTSHAVFVARNKGIPAVVALGNLSEQVGYRDVVLVDGYEGVVILNPSEATLFKYGERKKKRRTIEDRIIELSKGVPETTDGHRVHLMANIETASEAKRAVKFNPDGVGLLRTEFFFLNAQTLPTEDEQVEAYRQVVEAFGDKPVVIRTLDLGGDKMPAAGGMAMVREQNPFLGYRAIRYCLDNEALFKTQLRAILRTSVAGEVRVMYPMISGLGELLKAKSLFEEAKQELREKGIPFEENMQEGSMIEIPSAAIASDLLVAHTDFFSIGTNDLIQYMIAVDRLNDRVAHLYEPTHPSIIRVLDTIVESARKGKLSVCVCGEVAGDPVIVPLLIGLGVDTLSMAGNQLPTVNYIVRSMSMEQAKGLADMALAETDGSKILENLQAFHSALMEKLN